MLVKAATDAQLWGCSHRGNFANVFPAGCVSAVGMLAPLKLRNVAHWTTPDAFLAGIQVKNWYWQDGQLCALADRSARRVFNTQN